MNHREEMVKNEAISKGYEVLEKGWPDFLLFDPITKEAIFAEVKSYTNGGKYLSKEQHKMHKVLEELGLDIRIIRVPDVKNRGFGPGLCSCKSSSRKWQKNLIARFKDEQQ